jgi:hypothetical protein
MSGLNSFPHAVMNPSVVTPGIGVMRDGRVTLCATGSELIISPTSLASVLAA